MKRSSDNGRTWSPLQRVAVFPGDEAACDPCALVDRRTGRIWLAYDYAVPAEGGFRGRDLVLHMIYSDDEGETWSPPREFASHLMRPEWHALQIAPGVGLQTRNGALVLPAYTVAKDGRNQCRLITSVDGGETWTLSAGIGHQTGESQLAELDDGRILINMRQPKTKGCRAVATTADGGKTWTEAVDDRTLIDPCCQANIMRLTSATDGDDRSRLLFSNAANVIQRRQMTVRLSYDGGESWPVTRLLHAGRGPMYSCMAVLPDKTIGMLYESQLIIVFARFSLEWLTDGKDVRHRGATESSPS